MSEGELSDVLSCSGQQCLNPDGVETTAACSAEAATLLAITEDRLNPRLPLTDEAARWSGAEVSDGTVAQPVVIRPGHRADLGRPATFRLQGARGAVGRPGPVDNQRVGGRRSRPPAPAQGRIMRTAVGICRRVVAEGRAWDGAVVAATIVERDRRTNVPLLQPLVVVDRPVLGVGRDFEEGRRSLTLRRKP